MVSNDYARGWDDCLEALAKILEKEITVEQLKREIRGVHGLVKEKKFEKIRDELGIFGVF